VNLASRTPVSAALRLARKSWQLQFEDSDQSLLLAEQCLARVQHGDDLAAHAWGRLARGYHRMRHSTSAEGSVEIEHAHRCFDLLGDRRGTILAAVGLSRCAWMEGRLQEALDLITPLRDEGLRVLRQEERGMLLNGIAGCYSSQGDPAQAFAYMYQALRESSPAHNNGFDTVLFCNLAHELYQLGDCEAALSYVQEGLARCERLRNRRLKNVLHSNRILCLLELERYSEALIAARALYQQNAQLTGPGTVGVAFEALALAAAFGGDVQLGEAALTRAALTQPQDPLPEVQIDLAVAQARLLALHRYSEQAVQRLQQELPITHPGVSLRAHCLLHDTLAWLYGQLRHNALALEHLQHWRRHQLARSRLASQARYQAASLHTELLRVQRQRDDMDARRAATERASAQLLEANRQLQEKIQEVQALKDELQQQALRDGLTGLYNRRYLNQTLPTLFAITRREAQALAVVVIDLDHFKQVNDVHGHIAGDQVLQAFAELLHTQLRKSDVACRYGGEEFCLLMPGTTAFAARGKVAELLALWRAQSFHFDTGTLAGPSFSAGIADSHLDTAYSNNLLKCADDYALHAKRLGRNRICGAGLEQDGALPTKQDATVLQLSARARHGAE
jgi:diguanylate cyclase (GGDEF)-like protein